jgi:predicted nucleotidyltransferase
MIIYIEKVIATIKISADEIRQMMPVAKVFLYGSFAKGNVTDHSDVDVC